MSDRQTTLTTADGREIELTEDATEVDAYATGLTVALGQKTNLGNYENAEPYASIRAEVRPALALSADGSIDALRDHAERLGRVVRYHVTQAVEDYRDE